MNNRFENCGKQYWICVATDRFFFLFSNTFYFYCNLFCYLLTYLFTYLFFYFLLCINVVNLLSIKKIIKKYLLFLTYNHYRVRHIDSLFAVQEKFDNNTTDFFCCKCVETAVSVKRRLLTAYCRLRTRGKMQTVCKMQTADWE